jgi:hypothetical protein
MTAPSSGDLLSELSPERRLLLQRRMDAARAAKAAQAQTAQRIRSPTAAAGFRFPTPSNDSGSSIS